MPWRETATQMERAEFVSEHRKGCWSMLELCQAFGVSRKTGYKWLARYAEEGIEGLTDRSRAPRTQALRTPSEIEDEIVKMRGRYPRWGGKKIRSWLKRRIPEVEWPSRTTVDAILKRHGLVRERKRRRRCTPAARPLIEATSSNDVWGADYKGWFRLRNGVRCDPLTISDLFSRYLITCHGLVRPQLEDVRRHFRRAFQEYGLPRAILIDNGPPFGSTGLGGLTRLSVWWIRLGVTPVRIEPGKPQQNGIHERMHGTMLEVTDKPKATLRAQQAAFQRFRRTFNQERPHEALDMLTPADLYAPSRRPMPARLPRVEYPSDFHRRRVRVNGSFKWRRRPISASIALANQDVGLEEAGDGIWRVHFGRVLLGTFHEASGKIIPTPTTPARPASPLPP